MNVNVVRRRIAAVGLAVSLACACVAGAQVLQQLPADTLVVVRVANLGKVSAKAGDLAKKLGLDQMSPDAADPLKALEAKLGIKQGLDVNGEMAMAFIDPDKTGARDKSFVFLIPVSDYKEFLGNFADAKTEGDITETTTPEGEPAFVKEWGKYAAVSPSKLTLAAKPTGVKPEGSFANKELAEKDVVIFANFTALRPMMLSAIQKNRTFWLAELEKDVLAAPARMNADEVDPNDPNAVDEETAKRQAMAKKFLPVMKAAANKGIDIMEAFAKDATSATYSLNLTDAGINSTLAAEFKPDTYGGKLLSTLKGSSGSLLSGLPAAKYLVYGGMAWDSKALAPAWNDLVSPVLKELNTIDDADTKAIAGVIVAAEKSIGAATGYTSGLFAPKGQLMQEAILQQINIVRGDADTIASAQKELMAGQEQIMSIFQGQGIGSMKTTWTPAARQVDGVTFDAFKSEMAADPASPEAAQMQQMMSIMYGPEGVSGVSGKLDDKTVLIASGVSAANLSAAIKSAKANEEVLSKTEPVKATASQLPKTRIAEYYIAVDVILNTAMGYAQQNGLPFNVNFGENLPPVGMTLATDGPAIRGDFHVPTPLIQSVTSAFMQLYANFAPRGGGPQPQPPADNGGL